MIRLIAPLGIVAALVALSAVFLFMRRGRKGATLENRLRVAATCLRIDGDVAADERERRADALQALFAEDAVIIERGADGTSSRRRGNAAVRAAALAIFEYASHLDVTITDYSEKESDGETECLAGVEVTGRTRGTSVDFSRSSRLRLFMRRRDGTWIIAKAENTAPIESAVQSFDL